MIRLPSVGYFSRPVSADGVPLHHGVGDDMPVEPRAAHLVGEVQRHPCEARVRHARHVLVREVCGVDVDERFLTEISLEPGLHLREDRGRALAGLECSGVVEIDEGATLEAIPMALVHLWKKGFHFVS